MQQFLFQTKRLDVRPLWEADFPDFFALQGDPEVMRYTTGQAQNAQEARADLARVMARTADPEDGFQVWAVTHRLEGSLVGTAALVLGSEGGEIGYRLMRKTWGRGYGLELAAGLFAYARDTAGLDRIFAHCATDNAASIRILESLRMDRVAQVFKPEFGWQEAEYAWERG